MLKKKKARIAVQALPFVFALHNIEEAFFMGKPELGPQMPMIVSSQQFIIAVSLFTVLGFMLVFGRRFYPSPQSYRYAVIAFSGMLFLNSFLPHILSALFLNAYTPGLLTASLLVLPLTTYILWEIKQSHWFSGKQMTAAILLGGVCGFVLVFLFLGIGSLFTCST